MIKAIIDQRCVGLLYLSTLKEAKIDSGAAGASFYAYTCVQSHKLGARHVKHLELRMKTASRLLHLKDNRHKRTLSQFYGTLFEYHLVYSLYVVSALITCRPTVCDSVSLRTLLGLR